MIIIFARIMAIYSQNTDINIIPRELPKPGVMMRSRASMWRNAASKFFVSWP